VFRVGTRVSFLYRRGLNSAWPCQKRSLSARTVQVEPSTTRAIVFRVGTRRHQAHDPKGCERLHRCGQRSLWVHWQPAHPIVEASSELTLNLHIHCVPGRKSDVNARRGLLICPPIA